MPRRLNPLTERRGPGRSLQKISVAKLAVKVRKNTKILGSKEIGRIRITIDPTPDTTAVVQNISFVAQGDDVGDRHGRKIHARHVSVSGSIGYAGGAANTKNRMLIFRDNLGSTTSSSLTELFNQENDFFDHYHRLINEQPMKRFTVLWDKYIVINEPFDGALTVHSYKFSKKLNFDVLYTGTTASNEGKNSLWLMSGSNQVSAVPASTGDVVFKFSDL